MIGYREGKCVLCGKDGILNEGICERHSAEVAQAFLFGIEEGMKLAPSAWRSMEDAPKDGTWMQLWDGGPYPIVGRWTKHRLASTEGWACTRNYSLSPTAWMPLPPPPSSEKL